MIIYLVLHAASLVYFFMLSFSSLEPFSEVYNIPPGVRGAVDWVKAGCKFIALTWSLIPVGVCGVWVTISVGRSCWCYIPASRVTGTPGSYFQVVRGGVRIEVRSSVFDMQFEKRIHPADLFFVEARSQP